LGFIRRHLNYANVVATTCLFLLLGGATAFAARELAANSVGTRQLRADAVTAAKIRDGAVAGSKLAVGSVSGDKLGSGSVTTDKLADGSVTAAKLAPELPGSGRVVARVRGAGPQTLFEGIPYTLSNPTYTQAAREDDLYVGAATVTIPAGCAPPRDVSLSIALDAVPGVSDDSRVVGAATVRDDGTGTVTRVLNFGAFNSRATSRLAPEQPVRHTLTISGSSSCGPDGEAFPVIESAGVDVIGVR
jgi:hypothetical protein